MYVHYVYQRGFSPTWVSVNVYRSNVHRDVCLFPLVVLLSSVAALHGEERLFFFPFYQPTRPSYSSFLEFSTFIHPSCWFVCLNLTCSPLFSKQIWKIEELLCGEKWNKTKIRKKKKKSDQITTMSQSLKKNGSNWTEKTSKKTLKCSWCELCSCLSSRLYTYLLRCRRSLLWWI